MSPREQGFSEIYGWLDNGSEGPEPQPPEGLHQLALNEWNAGASAAHSEYEEEESAWIVTENFLVWLLKASALFTVAGAIYWIHEPWSMVLGGLFCLYLLRKWL